MTEKKKTLGRDVLATSGLKTKIAKVEEWGGEIRLRELSAADAAQATAYATADLATDAGAAIRAAAWMVARTWVDEDGALVLDEATGIDELINTQRADLIMRLANEAMVVSGLVKGAAEDAAKNSESSQSDDSGTA